MLFVENEGKIEEILLTLKPELASAKSRQAILGQLISLPAYIPYKYYRVPDVSWYHAPNKPRCPTASLEVISSTTKRRAHKVDSYQVTTTCRFPKVCP
jgi:hypothetical protein